MSGNSYFLFGLYVGLGVVILVMLVLLLLLNLLVIDEDETLIDDMKYIFPMFRGVGLLILYLWGVAWNVYGFIKYKINFKLVLKYGAHYSSPFQIMKRAGFFTLLFSLTLFLYLAGVQAEETSRVNLPLEYSPFLVWVVFFAYIFFPSQEMFNPKGRIYFYAILKSMLLSPLVKMGFVLSFATDQAVSFVTSIKDFAYTVCFYGSDFTVEQVSSCLNSDSLNGIITGYVAALLPLLIRLIQCYRTAYQNSDLFWGDLQMWNFFKYVSSILTSTLSFLNSLYPSMFIPFLISSVISTSYSYYWDLKYDWGLLEPDSKHFLLRNTLSYKRPSLYYIAIGINLIFRCSWTLTISPSVLVLIPKSTFLPFLTGFIEILRRCMWNFFRI
jgi:xenotropic and polytropic retrovirus receptor 1